MINTQKDNVNKKFKFGIHTQHILKTMCGIINVDVREINFNAPDWQDQYSWSFANEVGFQNWLIHYLQDNPAAVLELISMDAMGGKERWIDKAPQRIAKRYTLFYGWALDSFEDELSKVTEQTIHKN
jgi:hypothetical protein